MGVKVGRRIGNGSFALWGMNLATRTGMSLHGRDGEMLCERERCGSEALCVRRKSLYGLTFVVMGVLRAYECEHTEFMQSYGIGIP
jgi:hypothetical protein